MNALPHVHNFVFEKSVAVDKPQRVPQRAPLRRLFAFVIMHSRQSFTPPAHGSHLTYNFSLRWSSHICGDVCVRNCCARTQTHARARTHTHTVRNCVCIYP